MSDEAGVITVWIGSSTDIEDRKSVEESLLRQCQESETLSRSKDEFLATSSHELRTPLTSILGWSELLMMGDLDAETQLVAIDSILQSARAQSRLIDDMLDVSRLLTGKLELTSSMVDVAATLLLAIRAITPAAENKEIRIEKSFALDAMRVYGDGTRLQQIFWNILSNAVKFTPAGGSIAIRLFSDDSMVGVEVSDTGQGIAPDFLPRVFQSLSQEGGSSTRQHGGLGLGLAIVKQLVEMHGGTVRAESDGPGQGATFTVILPARGSEPGPLRKIALASSGRSPEPVDAAASIAGTRVLLVDDEAGMRTIIAAVLSGGGAFIVTATSAEDAFRKLETESFDLLVSDIAMPNEDGHSFIRRIRAAEHEWARIPSIALTAFGGPLQRELAMAAGFDGYLKKPFSPNDLLRSLAALLPQTAPDDEETAAGVS